jgi:hypothetical protein
MDHLHNRVIQICSICKKAFTHIGHTTNTTGEWIQFCSPACLGWKTMGEPHRYCSTCGKCEPCGHCKCPPPPVKKFNINDYKAGMTDAIAHAEKYGRADVVDDDGKLHLSISIPLTDINEEDLHPFKVRIYELEEILLKISQSAWDGAEPLPQYITRLQKLASDALPK